MTDHEEFDPALWFLVERDGELVACALHWKEQQSTGWVKDIAVADAERGHGLGSALLDHALRAYAARGVQRVGLKVDSSNPTGAPQLYDANRIRHRSALRHLDTAAVTTGSPTVSLLRWLRRQLREPAPQRERLEAAIANDDPAEARRIIDSMPFNDAQRHHVAQLLDEWEHNAAN